MNNEELALIFNRAANTRLLGKEPEESLIEQMLPAINNYLEKFGINLSSHIKGPDVRHGHIFIEFKAPYTIKAVRNRRIIINQSKKYLQAQYVLPTKGILTDGVYFIFLQKIENKYVAENPILIDSSSCARFLLILDELGISKYWEEKLDEFTGNNKLRKSDGTVLGYRTDVRQFLRFCIKNNIDPKHITLMQIDRFFGSLSGKSKYSVPRHKTLNRKASSISMFYAFLRKDGTIDKNLVEYMERFSIQKNQPNFLSSYEINKLRLFCTPEIRPIFEFLLATGCRASEAINLTWLHVHIADRTASVLGKGGKYREVWFTDAVADILSSLPQYKVYIGNTGNVANFVFNPENSSIGFNYQKLYYEIKKLGIRALGVPIHPHLLRHTAATQMVKGGVPIPEVKELLGHESLITTGLYVHRASKNRDSYSKAMHEIDGTKSNEK